MDPEPSDFPDETVVSFTIKGPDPEKDSFGTGIQVMKNKYNNAPDNATLSQILENERLSGQVEQPIQMTIDGYPAIKTHNSCDIEYYITVAPGFQTPNAVYTISFGTQCGNQVKNPYSESDPFVQQQLANFHLMVSSIRFPK